VIGQEQDAVRGLIDEMRQAVFYASEERGFLQIEGWADKLEALALPSPGQPEEGHRHAFDKWNKRHRSWQCRCGDMATDEEAEAADRQPEEGRERLIAEWDATPWPLEAVLRRLADAVSHLLSDHDCDHIGWEGVTYAKNRAIEMADALAAAPSEEVSEPQIIERAGPSPLAQLFADPKFIKQYRAQINADYRKLTRKALIHIINHQRLQIRAAEQVAADATADRKDR
jgi:hypothetical protein